MEADRTQPPSLDDDAPLLAPIPRPFRLRRMDEPHLQGAAADLVARRYAWRGYDAALLPQGDYEPSSVTIGAEASDGAVLGTMTVRIADSQSLHCAESYPDVIEPRLRRGERLAEVCRLAIETAPQSRVVFASMFHIAYLYCVMRGVDRVFIEVNPRHVAFYQRAIGFDIAAGERHCERANAPAVLLTIELRLIGRQLAAFGGLGAAAAKAARNSLYPYCFGRAEELSLVNRVLHMEVLGHELLFDGDLGAAKAA